MRSYYDLKLTRRQGALGCLVSNGEVSFGFETQIMGYLSSMLGAQLAGAIASASDLKTTCDQFCAVGGEKWAAAGLTTSFIQGERRIGLTCLLDSAADS